MTAIQNGSVNGASNGALDSTKGKQAFVDAAIPVK